MDIFQWISHSLQQMGSRHRRIPYFSPAPPPLPCRVSYQCLGFPIFLTTWHLIFASISTQILARTTPLLDGLRTVKMDGRTYLRAIVPIGLFFSLSLICSNQAYLYLSVAFIQMLKVRPPPPPPCRCACVCVRVIIPV
jgi:hypothetical protein